MYVCMHVYILYVCSMYYVCMYVCMVITYSRRARINWVRFCQSCSWSAEEGELIFPCPCSRLRIWYRETGSAVPSRVSLHPHNNTQTESGLCLRDSLRVLRRRPFIYFLNRHTPSGQSRVHGVTQLRSDGVRSLPRVRRHRASKPQGSSEQEVICLGRSPWTK